LLSIQKNVDKNYIIILDILTVHITKNVLDYYYKFNINISTYKSDFNSFELAFKIIILYLFKNLYENIEGAVKEVKTILSDKKIELSLKK